MRKFKEEEKQKMMLKKQRREEDKRKKEEEKKKREGKMIEILEKKTKEQIEKRKRLEEKAQKEKERKEEREREREERRKKKEQMIEEKEQKRSQLSQLQVCPLHTVVKSLYSLRPHPSHSHSFAPQRSLASFVQCSPGTFFSIVLFPLLLSCPSPPLFYAFLVAHTLPEGADASKKEKKTGFGWYPNDTSIVYSIRCQKNSPVDPSVIDFCFKNAISSERRSLVVLCPFIFRMVLISVWIA